MNSHLRFLLDSLRERLWVKPASYAALALLVILAVGLADTPWLAERVPGINVETIEALITIISASMLGVATFAVASMVSAYAAASRTTTPRAFALLVKDEASKNALSSFIGAFIFSVAGIVAIKLEYYGDAGRFLLFLLALGVLLWVVLTFVRWVDQIARLGRLGNTMDRVESALRSALEAWGRGGRLGGTPLGEEEGAEREVLLATTVGYVGHVDLDALQDFAAEHDARLVLRSPPGALVTLTRPLLEIEWGQPRLERPDFSSLRDAFVLADARNFVQDPRLGLLSLSEIASRALSPAVNDPGTAIECLSRLTRALSLWTRETLQSQAEEDPRFERLEVEALCFEDLLDDGFGAIARDGAGFVEVGIRLQKALSALAALGHAELRQAARTQAGLALRRAEAALTFPPDLERLRAAAAWILP